LLRQKTPIAAPKKTTDPRHSAWGSRLILHLSPLPKTRIPETAQNAPPPPSRRRDHHYTKCATSRQHRTPMGPLHLPAHTDQVSHHNRNSQGNITSRSPPLLPTEMVSRRGTPKKGTTLKTPLRHVHSGTRFSPWKLVLQGRVNPQWCPQQGERRPKGATTIATDSGDFHSQYHLCCTFSTTPLPGEARYSLRHHHGTTSMHLPTPRPEWCGPTSPSRRRKGAPPAEDVYCLYGGAPRPTSIQPQGTEQAGPGVPLWSPVHSIG
jgi:hypothetical protein